MASLAGLAVGGDDGNRGSAGHFGGRGLFVAVVDSEGEDSKIEDFANVGGATRLAQPKSWRFVVGHSFDHHPDRIHILRIGINEGCHE